MRNIGIRMGDFDVTAHHLNRITLKHPDRAKCNRTVWCQMAPVRIVAGTCCWELSSWLGYPGIGILLLSDHGRDVYSIRASV